MAVNVPELPMPDWARQEGNIIFVETALQAIEIAQTIPKDVVDQFEIEIEDDVQRTVLVQILINSGMLDD